MAVGKNRKLGKKGRKKKVLDPFLKKDWYTVQAPSMFTTRNAGLTVCTKTQGTKTSTKTLKGRIFEVSLADLSGNNPELAYRKIKLSAEEVQGPLILTNFYGMDMTRDKLCSLIKKWQTLIEARVDIKTTDGYHLRMFCIGFTKLRREGLKKTGYAQAGQVRQIRKKMVDIMTAESTKCDLKELVAKLLPESLGKDIIKACEGIYPLQNVYIRKVKVLQKPNFDLTKLLELHTETANDVGAKVDREDPAVVMENVAGSGGRL